MIPADSWRLFIQALRSVDPRFDLYWRSSQLQAEARVAQWWRLMPGEGRNGRCEVLRRALVLASGDPRFGECSDEDVIVAAKEWNIPI